MIWTNLTKQNQSGLLFIKFIIMKTFASLSLFIDQVVKEETRNENIVKKSLYLVASQAAPLCFFDISKTKLVFSDDDLESYLSQNPNIAFGSTICLENCEVLYELGENNIKFFEVECQNVIIDLGKKEEKKIRNCKIRLEVESSEQNIPLLPSTRRYIRRIQKQKIIRKLIKKEKTPNIVSFIKPNLCQDQEESPYPFMKQIGPLDSESMQLLEKLKYFVKKDQLFRSLISKPLKDKMSKKVVRLMVVPNEDNGSQDLKFGKKKYSRADVLALSEHISSQEEWQKQID